MAPRIAVEAAAEVGVRRVVLTSSVGALGPASGRPADERATYPERGTGMLYPDAKHEGERAAFAAGERLGVEVVAVNPAYVLGVPVNRSLPGETSTRVVSNYLRGGCRRSSTLATPTSSTWRTSPPAICLRPGAGAPVNATCSAARTSAGPSCSSESRSCPGGVTR